MTTRFVCNASPLIGFERLGRLDLLQSLTRNLLIPPAVGREVFDARTPPDWVEVCPLSSASSPALLAPRLGDGESEAIALARELGDCILLLDDLAARRVAQSLQIRVSGTVGLMVQAKQRGLVTSIRPLLDELLSYDFRISPRLYALALKQAGESL
jgi:predicted nucleic acid-binding protein